MGVEPTSLPERQRLRPLETNSAYLRASLCFSTDRFGFRNRVLLRQPLFLYVVDKCVAGVWLVVTTITSKTLSAKK